VLLSFLYLTLFTNNKDILDIGGGFPGITGGGEDYDRFIAANNIDVSNNERDHFDDSNVKTFIEIATALRAQLDKHFPPSRNVRIISEPGRYFFEGAFALAARIYSKEEFAPSGDDDNNVTRVYWISEGVGGIFRDVTLVGETFDATPIFLADDNDAVKSAQLTVEKCKNASGDEKLFNSIIRGPTNNKNDVVLRKMLPNLCVGTYLLFDRVGAYTLSIASNDKQYNVTYV